MIEDLDILNSLFYRTGEIKKSEGILHLTERELDNKHPLTYYSEVTHNHERIHDCPLFLYDDFFFISNDLVHFTTLLYLLRPFINDSSKEGDTYFQRWYDARYLSYAGILHSSLYNFWDRIGDLLNCFFDTGLAPDRVYIKRVLENFPKEDKSSKIFIQLKDDYEQLVQPTLAERDEDVHNQSIPTTHYFAILLARGKEKLDKSEQKFQIADKIKEQIDIAYRGFELALRLIIERVPKLEE